MNTAKDDIVCRVGEEAYERILKSAWRAFVGPKTDENIFDFPGIREEWVKMLDAIHAQLTDEGLYIVTDSETDGG